jgi:hypothetical protein
MSWRCMGGWRYSSTTIDLSTRWRWLVSFMAGRFIPLKTAPYPLERRLRGSQSRSGCYGEEKGLLPCREFNPDRPAHSPSLSKLLFSARVLGKNKTVIQFNSLYIYLRSELSNQWLIRASTWIQITADNTETTNQTTSKGTTEKKMDQLRLFTLRHELLKISALLRTTFIAEIHLTEGQWLKEELTATELRMFPIADRFEDKWAIFSVCKYIY